MEIAMAKKSSAKAAKSEATKQLAAAIKEVKAEKKELLKTAIESRLDQVRDDTLDDVEIQHITFETLMDVVAEVLKDGKITQADYEPVAQVVEELFEDYVRDFDIPGVPPILERFVDNAMKSMIRPVLRQLFETFAAA